MRTHWRGRALPVAVGLAVALLGVPATAQAAEAVRINEVESNGGSPGDWVELVNTGSATVDVSGWVLKDGDDSHAFTIAAGTSLAPGARVALDVEPVFGLGSADSARLYRGGTLVDGYTWSAHATTTYGRCADGSGGFATTTASTKGTANACATVTSAWPGGSAVSVADGSNVFGTNLSGLSFESPTVLWAVKNGTGTLYRLVPSGSTWRPDPAGGKVLHYAGGGGDPDAEGVVVTSEGLFVVTERDNANGGTSLPKILRFDPTSTSSNATAEWNLKADLPSVAANSGPEGISWIPDSVLTARGFRDERTGGAYDPSAYPGHGGGLFFVGLEANGAIYAYALTSTGGGYTRIATVASGFTGVMDLEFEASTGKLWAACDDTCQGRTTTLEVDARGRFAVTAVHDRPTGMSNHNNEGFAIAPQSTCAAGRKPVLWADDGNTGGHALRSGTVTC